MRGHSVVLCGVVWGGGGLNHEGPQCLFVVCVCVNHPCGESSNNNNTMKPKKTNNTLTGKSAPRAESPLSTTRATTQKDGVNHEATHFFFFRLLPVVLW